MLEVINGKAVDVYHGLDLKTASQSISSSTDDKLLTNTTLLKSAEQILALSATKLGTGPHWLQTSPYSDGDHRLDLHTLDLPEQLLAIALAKMAPLDADYAITEYSKAFNWDVVVEELRSLAAAANFAWRKREYYVVVFRSQLNAACDRTFLGQLDKNSHREAVVSGGLLKYWFGSPNAARRNLATCECTGPGRRRCGG